MEPPRGESDAVTTLTVWDGREREHAPAEAVAPSSAPSAAGGEEKPPASTELVLFATAAVDALRAWQRCGAPLDKSRVLAVVLRLRDSLHDAGALTIDAHGNCKGGLWGALSLFVRCCVFREHTARSLLGADATARILARAAETPTPAPTKAGAVACARGAGDTACGDAVRDAVLAHWAAQGWRCVSHIKAAAQRTRHELASAGAELPYYTPRSYRRHDSAVAKLTSGAAGNAAAAAAPAPSAAAVACAPGSEQLAARTKAAEAEASQLAARAEAAEARVAALERNAALRRAEAAEAALQAARAEAAEHDATLRRAEVAEAESARLTALVTSLERNAALRRAEAAEEKVARLQSDAATLASCAEAAEARAAALERDAHAAVLGKRSAEARADELLAEVATKQARLDAADAAAAAATAEAARATTALEAAATCRVCLLAPRQMVFSPCNHLAVCKACSEELNRRVADRAPVATRVRRAPPPASPPKPRCPVC